MQEEVRAAALAERGREPRVYSNGLAIVVNGLLELALKVLGSSAVQVRDGDLPYRMRHPFDNVTASD
jgi:hypothetical protein